MDDWNWARVREGTLEALRDEGREVLFSLEIRSTHDGSDAAVTGPESAWHNGYLLGVCRKKPARS